MKKLCLLATILLSSLHTAFAIDPQYKIIATIGIKNTTNDSVDVSCNIAGTYPIGSATLQAGEARIFPQTTAYNGCPIDSVITCSYTDKDTAKTGNFVIQTCEKYVSWNTYQNTISLSSTGKPPTQYKCSDSPGNITSTVPGNTYCGSNAVITITTCTVQAYLAIGTEGVVGPTYTLAWHNIKANQVVGQAMAAKLTSILQNTGTYGRPTASYKDNTLTIVLPPPLNPNPNPYAGLSSASQCKSACVSS